MSQSRQNCCLHFGQVTQSPGLFPVQQPVKGRGFRRIKQEHVLNAILLGRKRQITRNFTALTDDTTVEFQQFAHVAKKLITYIYINALNQKESTIDAIYSHKYDNSHLKSRSFKNLIL